MDVEDLDDELFFPESQPTIEGFLLKGPEAATDKMFANITTKSFKRRFCKLRQDIAGSYFLDICKEDKKQEAALSICLDECEEVVAYVQFLFKKFIILTPNIILHIFLFSETKGKTNLGSIFA